LWRTLLRIILSIAVPLGRAQGNPLTSIMALRRS
jgi:hypothetical protein